MLIEIDDVDDVVKLPVFEFVTEDVFDFEIVDDVDLVLLEEWDFVKDIDGDVDFVVVPETEIENDFESVLDGDNEFEILFDLVIVFDIDVLFDNVGVTEGVNDSVFEHEFNDKGGAWAKYSS